MEKTYRFVQRFNPMWIMVVVFVAVAIALLSTLKSMDPTSITASILVIGFIAFTFYRQKRGLQRAMDRKLILNEVGLRYEISGNAYELAWSQCDHRIERTGRDAEVILVTLVTRDREWVPLNRFEDMPSIIATIRLHVPASGPRNIVEAMLLLYRWPGFLLGGLALLGMCILLGQKQITALPADQSQFLGIVLFAPTALVSWYMWSRSPLMKLGRAVQQQNSGTAMRRFFINLLVWIVIVIVTLLVLNFMMQKPH